MLKVFVGKEHGNKKHLEFENKGLKLILPHGIPFSNDVEVIVKEAEAGVSSTVGEMVALFLLGGYGAGFHVGLSGVPLTLVKLQAAGPLARMLL